MRKDYYGTLGVPADATSEAIRKAYRQKAFELHPDRNGGSHRAEEAFKEVTEAYAILGDPERRAAYDRGAHNGSATPEFDPADLFADLFHHPLLGPLFAQLSREFGRQGLRFDETYFRRVLSGTRGGMMFGGFVFVWPFGGLFPWLAGSSRPSVAPAERGPLPPRPRGLLARLLGTALPGRVAPNPRSTDVHYTLPVREETLRNGGQVRVSLPGPQGPASYVVNIPAGIRSGTRLRLAGCGAGSDSSRGHLYLEVRSAD